MGYRGRGKRGPRGVFVAGCISFWIASGIDANTWVSTAPSSPSRRSSPSSSILSMAFSVTLGLLLAPVGGEVFEDVDWRCCPEPTASNTAATDGESSRMSTFLAPLPPDLGLSFLPDPGEESVFSDGLISSFSRALMAAEKESFPSRTLTFPSPPLPPFFCLFGGEGEASLGDFDCAPCNVTLNSGAAGERERERGGGGGGRERERERVGGREREREREEGGRGGGRKDR